MAERTQYTTLNRRNYLFYDDGKGSILVYYEDKSGKESKRIEKKAEKGGYGGEYTVEQIKELIYENEETKKTYVTLGVFLKGNDGKYEFLVYPVAFEKENGNEDQARYFVRESRKQGPDVYVENIFTNSSPSEAAPPTPAVVPATTEAAAPTTQTPAPTTQTPAAPAELDARQIEYWNKISEVPPELLSESSKTLLQAVKDAYPDQITDKPLTKEQLEKLSPTEQAAIIQRATVLNKRGKDVDAASITSGSKIILADPCKDNFFAELEAKLSKFFKVITKAGKFIGNLKEEINIIVAQVGTLAKQLIGKITSAISKKLETLIKEGLGKRAKQIFDTVTDNPIAKIIKEQSGLIEPTKALFGALKCLVANITEALEKSISDLITGMVKNVINTPRCAVEQFIGGLINKITSLIDSTIGPLLEPVQKALGFVFKVRDAVKSAIQIIRKIQNLFTCDEERKCPASTEWKVDSGNTPGNSEGKEQDSFSKAMDRADKALDYRPSQGTANLISDFERQYGKWDLFGDGTTLADVNVEPCNTGNVFQCGSPKVEFFGGGGFGAAGNVLLGNFVDNLDSENIFGDIKKTGSIIGVEITNPGGRYKDAPLVAFSDGCDQGYGGYGKAIIDTNPSSPNYGKVTSVIITSQGEGYPVDEYEVKETFIDDVIIENPGSGYADDDFANDDLKLVIENGSITSVEVISQKPYTELPEININTVTGYGAVIRPVMRTRRKPQQEVVQVIDCVS